MPHPRSSTLSRHADAEPGARDRRVAAHLLRCPRCRAEVDEIRALARAARAASVPPPASDALARILARRAEGEHVVLPVADAPTLRRVLPGRGMIAAAAAVVLLIAAALLLRPRELEAGRSELRLFPATPRPGQVVRVEYRAGSLLDGQPKLVLRARERTIGFDGVTSAPVRRIAVLRRGSGGVYTGAFLLPDSVAYAVLALEDTAAARVDANGEAWDVVVSTGDGRLAFAALEMQYRDLSERDVLAAARVARRIAELYPDEPRAWSHLYAAESQIAPAAGRDSLRAIHLQRLHLLAAKVDAARADAGTLATMARYAGMLDDSAQAALWRARLIALHPASPEAVSERVGRVLDANRGHFARELDALERLWGEGGAAYPYMAVTAGQIAARQGDARAVLRWAERAAAADPALLAFAARMAQGRPEIRREAMELARRAVRALEQADPEQRPLTETAAEHRATRRRAAAWFLGELGRSLAAERRPAAARDTLDLALASTWDPALFRTVADARLALGDTAGASAAMARVAADPETAPAYADSARARLGGAAAGWAAELARARRDLAAFVMSQAVSRPVRGRIRLADARGARVDVAARGPSPTLVVFWSRYCPSSLAQLDQANAMAGRLRERGVRVLAITSEAPSDGASAFLSARGYTLPVLYDVDRAAGRAFDNAYTPRYLVLDRAGRVRFDDASPEDVPRQVAVLSHLP